MLKVLLCAIYVCFGLSFRSHLPSRRSYTLQTPKLYQSSQLQTSSINILYDQSNLKPSDPVDKLIRDTIYAGVKKNDTVATALETMTAIKRSSVLVVDDNLEVAGIFTERDFIKRVLEKGLSPSELVMENVMTPKSQITLVNSKESIKTCREMMLRRGVRHLPVVNDDEKAVGVISMTQLIRAIQKETMELESANYFGQTVKEVETQSKERANLIALEENSSQQDTIRTLYVVSGAVAGASLLQADWIHNHEYLAMSAIFLLGYIGIIFENYFEFNKAAIALLMCTALWIVYANGAGASGLGEALHSLSEKVSEVSEVVFFILGAMTIVEIVDAHQGFKVVTDKINSKTKRDLMGIVGFITFFMSAILDNLTTTIVMVSVMKKLLPNIDDRKLFGALIVIAANAGGAWTPIGDVTTTMLWINGQISALPTMTNLFLPSIVSTIIPIFMLQQQIPETEPVPEKTTEDVDLAPRGLLVFATGIAGLLAVPIFKSVTGLPPYLGMLASLGVMWTLTDAIHAGEREELMAPAALRKIDTSGVLFFLGILMSVGALDSAGILRSLAEFLDNAISSESLLATFIGMASALIDNVPLVAATMGMYPLSSVPEDSQLWQLIAYCAGTGGSLLVIGSAAGVALMGLEKVDFVWYAKRITLAAFLGYVAGIGTYLGQTSILSQFVTDTTVAASHFLQSGFPLAFSQ